MSFTFEPRALLELGKELISSDEVAIYELIKNAIDAGSSRTELIINTCLLRSTVDDIDEKAKRENTKYSIGDAIEQISAEWIGETNTAAHELMNQLRDADNWDHFFEHLWAYYNTENKIEVRDSGEGMSLSDLTKVYLKVGTRSRQEQNLLGARNLGDKGIGRLSAMRLGEKLRVRTSRAGEVHWNILEIDWGRFSHNSKEKLEDIKFVPCEGERKEDSQISGTVITISELSANWDRSRFADILEGHIARMIDPFEPGLANKILVARHNGSRILIPSVPKELLKSAHAVCRAEFEMLGNEPVLTGTIDYRLRHRSAKIDARGAQVYSLSQKSVKRRAKRGHATYRLQKIKPSTLQKLGKFSCEIYWFNRTLVDAVAGLSSKPTETRSEIANWSGGPMLYRYGFRILPYGDPKDDWLALDEAAFSAKGFKLNRQQVLGRVLLETRHDALGEQTNREGLVQSDVSEALTKILQWLVHVELRGLINEADKLENMAQRAAENGTSKVIDAQRNVEQVLKQFADQENIDPKLLNSLSKSVKQLGERSSELVHRIEKVIVEAEAEREKFVYLAGIGLMTEFIFHELDRAVSHTIKVISRGGMNESTITSLEDQLTTLHKRISAFDELTGEKRQRKSKFDLGALIQEVISNHEKEFERHGIEFHVKLPAKTFQVTAVRGMMIQILENLISNSAYWLKQQVDYEIDFKPCLTITLDGKHQLLSVEDNGPGVDEDRVERIFQPFITSKPSGQGRGLGLYIARELAEYHGWSLAMSDEIGTIRKGRVNEFLLDMG